MKILHTSDLHFNKLWFEWIEEQQKNYDIFCITGDFIDDSKDETLQEQIVWVSSWMKTFKKPLFICSGNHDIEELENEDWFNKIPNIYCDNSIKTINGITFGCVPYIAAEFFDFTSCDILLSHVPPSKTKTAIHKRTNQDLGDKDLFRYIKSETLTPKYLLCGHLHKPSDSEDILKNTKIINSAFGKNLHIPNYSIIEV